MDKIVLGTAQFGMNYGINNTRGKIPPSEVAVIIKKAVEHNINILDTAWDYGIAEAVIGKIIKQYDLRLRIISKFPVCKQPQVKMFLASSLKTLRCQSLYGYLLHDFQAYQKDKNIWQELLRLKQNGKIKKIGFSLYYPSDLYSIFKDNIKVDIIQIPFNVFDQRFKPYLAELKKRNIEIYARSVFLQGLIFKKSSELNDSFEPLQKKADVLSALSDKLDIPLLAICLNFVIGQKLIDKVIVGVDSSEHLSEILLAQNYFSKIASITPQLEQLAVNEEKIILPVNWKDTHKAEHKEKVIAIIQARTSSTRLAAKVLLNLEGKTVLEHVIERVEQAKLVDEVIVATTFDKNDLKLVDVCSQRGTRVFCGSRDDVLDRYYQAARLTNPTHVVRITADCPIIDPKVIDETIAVHLAKKVDYTGNRTESMGFPDGQDVEVFKFEALEKAWRGARLSSEREHVTPYIKNHPELFKFGYHNCFTNLYHKRWTLDREDDFLFIKLLYKKLYRKNNFFGMKEILSLLKEHPEYEKINDWILLNEGYIKSLREDKIVKTD
ncbi:MAG: aldo/keto reductase [Candidatus Omnitrophota bacterium]